MLNKIKISAVSYQNTIPFLYGMENSDYIDRNTCISLDIPSECARKLLDNEVDIGLVPVAVLPFLEKYEIISDYCIGSQGNVKSVLLLSDVPLTEIETIFLDYQSRTSVSLIIILAKYFWKINPFFKHAKKGYEQQIGEKNAGVVIGDRCFTLAKKFKYVYDLSGEWTKYTQLPFVFACWVANKQIDNEFINQFNLALKSGIEHIDQSIKKHSNYLLTNSDLADYLKNDIQFLLDEKKREGLKLFLEFLQKE
jgi:chorismate dehydratase